MKKDIGIFMPGRLNSERLPGKLLLTLNEKGDTLWSIACRKLAALPDEYNVYALAYDKELISVAREYGLNVIKRDKGTTEADGPLTYIYGDMEPTEHTHLMFLNPCLLFLSVDAIIEAVEEFKESDSDYATSVIKLENWLFDKKGKSLNDIDYKVLSTKEIEPIYQAAHAFHICNKDNFFKDGQMLKEGHQIIEIPEEEAVDVDNFQDFEIAKAMWNNR